MKTTGHFPYPFPLRIRILSCSRSRSPSISHVASERAWPKRLSQSDRRPQPKKTDDPFSLLPHSSACCFFFMFFLVSFFFFFLQSTGSQSRVLGLSDSSFGFSCEFEFEVQAQSLGPSVVRSILITLIKVLPSLVFFTPFLTNYAGISCFRFCSFEEETTRPMVALLARAALNSCSLSALRLFFSLPLPHFYLSLTHSPSLFLFLSLCLCNLAKIVCCDPRLR